MRLGRKIKGGWLAPTPQFGISRLRDALMWNIWQTQQHRLQAWVKIDNLNFKLSDVLCRSFDLPTHFRAPFNRSGLDRFFQWFERIIETVAACYKPTSLL